MARLFSLLLLCPLAGCYVPPPIPPECNNDARCSHVAHSQCEEVACVDGACTVLMAGGLCDDGDACTEEDRCVQGFCEGLPLSCDDGIPCTVDDCAEGVGCVASADQCECESDAGCDDQDPCNGQETCQYFACSAGVPVDCSHLDSACAVGVCSPGGTCETGAANNDTSCDDSNACTVMDACLDGACVGSERLCEDGVLCSEDSCDPELGCQFDLTPCGCLEDADCSNGDPCDGVETCAADGQCKAGTAVDCSDLSTACVVGVCDQTGSCEALAQTGACDDGNACTEDDQCVEGTCSGSPVSCSDGLLCSVDSCDPAIGCQSDLSGCECTEDSECIDDLKCNGAESCDIDGKCVAGIVVDCSGLDGTCATGECSEPSGGCLSVPLTGPCDDGDPCTAEDACEMGICLGNPVACDDGLECSVDTCDAATGCAFDVSGCDCTQDSDCDDELHCNGVESCSPDATCVAGTPTDCSDLDQMCGQGACQQGVGCVLVPLDGEVACDDGEVCTANDLCTAAATCEGSPVECDDGIACTVDVCADGVGCASNTDACGCSTDQDCNDNEPCNGMEMCDPATLSCLPGESISSCPLELALGSSHTCVALQGGAVKCWGKAEHGQLGTGDSEDQLVPATLAPTVTTDLFAGDLFTCAVDSSGSSCWGQNLHGQLGTGNFADQSYPTAIITEQSFVHGAAGLWHACAVSDADEVFCWGYGALGALGTGSVHADEPAPLEADVTVFGLETVAQVALGTFHSCARTASGLVACWGYGGQGRLGTGGVGDELKGETVLLGDTIATDLACGSAHCCVVTDSGSVLCWGDGNLGQLGDGNTGESWFSSTPVLAALEGSAVSVECGYGHSCALMETGAVHCWGEGWSGQLGNSMLQPSPLPVVAALGELKAARIGAGGSHTCAVMEDGSMYCWGSNSFGQLGDGTTEKKSNATLVLWP